MEEDSGHIEEQVRREVRGVCSDGLTQFYLDTFDGPGRKQPVYFSRTFDRSRGLQG